MKRCSRRWRRCSFFYPLLVFLSHDIFSPLPPTIIALSMLSPVLICFNFSREERIHHLSLPPDNSWQKRHKNVLHSCLAFHCIPWISWEWWSSAHSWSSQFNYHFSFKESFYRKTLLVSLAEKKIKNEHLLRSPFCSLLFYCWRNLLNIWPMFGSVGDITSHFLWWMSALIEEFTSCLSSLSFYRMCNKRKDDDKEYREKEREGQVIQSHPWRRRCYGN